MTKRGEFSHKLLVLLQTLGDIAIDLSLTAALLFSLMAIRRLLSASDLPSDFGKLFERIHEYVFLANYLLLALRGFVRLATAPWKSPNDKS